MSAPSLVFVAGGVVLWKIGFLMGIGQFLGAQTGSRLAMKNGARLIKPLLVITCVALAIRLLADPTNPIRVWMGSEISRLCEKLFRALYSETSATPERDAMAKTALDLGDHWNATLTIRSEADATRLPMTLCAKR